MCTKRKGSQKEKFAMAAYSITLSGGGTLLNADGGTLLLDYEHVFSECPSKSRRKKSSRKDNYQEEVPGSAWNGPDYSHQEKKSREFEVDHGTLVP